MRQFFSKTQAGMCRASRRQFKQRNLLQPEFIEQAIATYKNGHSGYYGELVWIIVVLELWLEQHEAADAS